MGASKVSFLEELRFQIVFGEQTRLARNFCSRFYIIFSVWRINASGAQKFLFSVCDYNRWADCSFLFFAQRILRRTRIVARARVN